VSAREREPGQGGGKKMGFFAGKGSFLWRTCLFQLMRKEKNGFAVGGGGWWLEENRTTGLRNNPLRWRLESARLSRVGMGKKYLEKK